jgi:hypothetical protein
LTLRMVVSTVVGIIQGVMGAFAVVFAFLFYNNILDIQTVLNLPTQSMPLYLFLLLIFGFLSIVSGVSLIHEWLESR